jgi:hypothetical protein
MILLLRISILQLLRGDFFDSIDPEQSLIGPKSRAAASY